MGDGPAPRPHASAAPRNVLQKSFCTGDQKYSGLAINGSLAINSQLFCARPAPPRTHVLNGASYQLQYDVVQDFETSVAVLAMPVIGFT
jgi:hypothetical protein